MSDLVLSPRVLELLVSRVCHDLVSPVGAINNGVEFLEDMGADAGDDAMNLIKSSVHQATIRLKNFRLCYGAAGTEKNVTFREIRETFHDLMVGNRAGFSVADGADTVTADPPRGYYKTLLNLLILAEECSHGDGEIVVAPLDGGAGHSVTVTSSRAAFREGAEDALTGKADVDALDPRSVHPYVTGALARFYNVRITHALSPKEKVSFSLHVA